MVARIAGFAAEANQTVRFHNAQFGGLLDQINALGVVQDRLTIGLRDQTESLHESAFRVRQTERKEADCPLSRPSINLSGFPSSGIVAGRQGDGR